MQDSKESKGGFTTFGKVNMEAREVQVSIVTRYVMSVESTARYGFLISLQHSAKPLLLSGKRYGRDSDIGKDARSSLSILLMDSSGYDVRKHVSITFANFLEAQFL